MNGFRAFCQPQGSQAEVHQKAKNPGQQEGPAGEGAYVPSSPFIGLNPSSVFSNHMVKGKNQLHKVVLLLHIRSCESLWPQKNKIKNKEVGSLKKCCLLFLHTNLYTKKGLEN